MLKYGWEQLVVILKKLYENILRQQKVLTKLKGCITIPVFSNGNKERPKNYRDDYTLRLRELASTGEDVLESILANLSIHKRRHGILDSHSMSTNKIIKELLTAMGHKMDNTYFNIIWYDVYDTVIIVNDENNRQRLL